MDHSTILENRFAHLLKHSVSTRSPSWGGELSFIPEDHLDRQDHLFLLSLTYTFTEDQKLYNLTMETGAENTVLCKDWMPNGIGSSPDV